MAERLRLSTHDPKTALTTQLAIQQPSVTAYNWSRAKQAFDQAQQRDLPNRRKIFPIFWRFPFPDGSQRVTLAIPEKI
jgi:hypothetical protein